MCSVFHHFCALAILSHTLILCSYPYHNSHCPLIAYLPPPLLYLSPIFNPILQSSRWPKNLATMLAAEALKPIQKGQHLPSPSLAASSPPSSSLSCKIFWIQLHCKQVTEFLGYFSQDKDVLTFIQ
jgi:hypothetical protein